MGAPAHLQTLYEALEALPEGVVGEVIDGQLYAHPRPAAVHALISSRLGSDLIGPFDRGRGGPGGWWILDEPEIHFHPNAEVMVPDIAGWRRARMPVLPEDQRFTTVPDWICEILSPTTASKDREVKMPRYAHFGVAYAWLVDPKTRTVAAYTRDATGTWQPTARAEGSQPIVAPPFEAVAVPPPWAES